MTRWPTSAARSTDGGSEDRVAFGHGPSLWCRCGTIVLPVPTWWLGILRAPRRTSHQTASASGAVEIWELANPTPGVAGAALSHTLSANAKRVMGVHALAGVGGHGTPVGAGVNSNAISVNVAVPARRPRPRRHLRPEQHHRPHRRRRTDRCAGSTEHHRRHQQPARRRLVRGRGGHDHDELDVGVRHAPRPAGRQLQPGHPFRAATTHRARCSQPDRRQRRQRQRGAELDTTGLRRRQPDHRLRDLARHDQRHRQPADSGRAGHQLHRHQPSATARPTTTRSPRSTPSTPVRAPTSAAPRRRRRLHPPRQVLRT